jgi:selenide, water dikinase
VCGAGAAGIELSFAFKNRWSKLFKQDIKTTLICSEPDIMLHESKAARDMTKAKLQEHGISIINNAIVDSVNENGIVLKDGRVINCNVPVWATGAEPQLITMRSNIEVLDNYFRVNDYLQSTSHPNVFAGGDCITMESYSRTANPQLEKSNFPPKAGVYAVREGPFIA